MTPSRFVLCATATLTAAAFGVALWLWRYINHDPAVLDDWHEEYRR